MSEDTSYIHPLSTVQHGIDQERLELLDLLLEAVADGFLDWRLESNTVQYSERLKLLLGYEDGAEPDSAWAWLERTHPEDRPTLARAIQDLIAGDWPFDMNFRVHHGIVGWRWLRARAVVRRDASGAATRAVLVVSDITAQVRAERRQSSLLNAVPDLLIRVQNDSTVVHVKIPEADELYAVGVPSPGERLIGSAFASGWSSQIESALAKAHLQRRSCHFEAKRLVGTALSQPCDIEVRVSPSSDEELILVIRDITAEKHQREQGMQSQKLEAIGQLAAGIAHEINTPLQFVGDNLNFLAEAANALEQALNSYRACTPEALVPQLRQVEEELDIEYLVEHLKPAFSAAIDGVQRVSVIVQAMKAFAHPGPKEKRPEDLNSAIETTLTISTNVWKYYAEIERDFSPNLPKIDCVIGEINQVFLNLITNAAHAIGDLVGDSENKGKIRISTRSDGNHVEIRIADTGGGIPAAIHSRVFEPFFTTKPVGKGTGQGLSLARAIVLQHNGTLTFETEAGKGTTFILRLPVG